MAPSVAESNKDLVYTPNLGCQQAHFSTIHMTSFARTCPGLWLSFEEEDMARCELTGKGPVVKNLVSHSNIKTKSVAMPNVQSKRLYSQTLNEFVQLKVATSTIRSMEHQGGFDAFVLRAKDKDMSKRALTVKQRIARKIKGS